ncbi:MAG: zinc-ribbon domain-containing protein [Clostridia bacterium]|nr:zinc-ribbon domain-containing protein [Clostridia bacterium]
MENYIGKICPFCRTEIKEEDTVRVCPSCDIAHHEGCWEENKGCTTFGCSGQHHREQNASQVVTCTNCGAPLGEDQDFCPKCGMRKTVPQTQKSFCINCGVELQEGQDFCPKCGHRAGTAAPVAANAAAINQFNDSLTNKKKKSKAIPIVIAVVLVVAALICVFAIKAANEKKAEKAREEYIENVEEFLALSLTAGSNLEDIADTIQEYWYENIWEDKHGSDINDAILYAMIDKADEISEAETYDSQMKSLYSQIKSVPDDIADEDVREIEDICDAVKDLYNVYTDFYALATDPSGSYNSYSASNSDTTDEFLSCYRALDNLLD